MSGAEVTVVLCLLCERYLARALDALHDAEVDEHPGNDQRTHDVPVEALDVADRPANQADVRLSSIGAHLLVSSASRFQKYMVADDDMAHSVASVELPVGHVCSHHHLHLTFRHVIVARPSGVHVNPSRRRPVFCQLSREAKGDTFCADRTQ